MLTDPIFFVRIQIEELFMTKATQWIPVLLPKDIVKELLKEYAAIKGQTSYMGLLKSLQKKVKAVKLFKGVSQQQIMKKLHQTRRKLLKENPHAYIDHTA